MKHLTHTLLIAALAFGFFAMLSVSDAEAGWYQGRGCYRPSYSSYSYSSCYRPTYSSSYCAPTIYRSTWSTPYVNSCYSNAYYSNSCYSGGYYGGYGYGGYNNCGYRGNCGYQPLTTYGSYGAIGGGYAVPVSYGYCGW